MIVIFYSCEADIDINNISGGTSIHPTVIVPIGSASISLGDFMLNNMMDEIVVGEDNEIYFQVIDSAELRFKSINMDLSGIELVKRMFLTDKEIFKTTPFSEIVTNVETGFIELGLNSNPTEERVDSMEISAATLNFQIDVNSSLTSLQPSNMIIFLNFPKDKIRKKDGTNGTFVFSPDAFGKQLQIKMSNFVMNTQDGATGIPVEISIVLITGATPIILDYNSMIVCSMNFNEINYNVAYGYFNPELFANYTFQQLLNPVESQNENRLRFYNPQVEISIENYIGSYLIFKIEYIKAFVKDNVNVEPVFARFDQQASNSVNFVFDERPFFPGEKTEKILPVINENWGGTTELFSKDFMPDVIEYNFSVLMNKELNQNDPVPQFVTSNASINAYVKTTLPLHFNKGSFYTFNGTFKNVFDDIAEALEQFPENSISSSSLIINIKNGLPVKSQFNFEILDSKGDIVPTDFVKEYVIESGVTNPDGIVIAGNETNQTVTVSVTMEQLKKLREANSIAYSIVLEGEDLESKIHFNNLNTLDLKVGLYINGKKL
jgi:hypothetical protein